MIKSAPFSLLYKYKEMVYLKVKIVTEHYIATDRQEELKQLVLNFLNECFVLNEVELIMDQDFKTFNTLKK